MIAQGAPNRRTKRRGLFGDHALPVVAARPGGILAVAAHSSPAAYRPKKG